MPDELGGDNLGPYPEQLFAAGYAACFHERGSRAVSGRRTAGWDSLTASSTHLWDAFTKLGITSPGWSSNTRPPVTTEGAALS